MELGGGDLYDNGIYEHEVDILTVDIRGVFIMVYLSSSPYEGKNPRMTKALPPSEAIFDVQRSKGLRGGG